MEKAVLAPDKIEFLRRKVKQALEERRQCFDNNQREMSPLETGDRVAIAVYKQVLQFIEEAEYFQGVNPREL